ncbi:transmembrane protein, putative (macronuclear) [Tetrahymena thermophila SB210]|uniref:Transmembrane protein, putative n=1 Tax=Tetrahymena thermophila (strain SB210) TaxID=312017 RepID=W7XGU5_TETTS|nr:transmembrane protein, putative [Tetrahymena thermophila SB210]EWS76278.1 transmembrane protein, putative [Tetrahymena thermophila SB210]|eukprot:XP_012651188.1 transmembrane protein, putative [Tetrahymena thermophila SB210]
MKYILWLLKHVYQALMSVRHALIQNHLLIQPVSRIYLKALMMIQLAFKNAKSMSFKMKTMSVQNTKFLDVFNEMKTKNALNKIKIQSLLKLLISVYQWIMFAHILIALFREHQIFKNVKMNANQHFTNYGGLNL